VPLRRRASPRVPTRWKIFSGAVAALLAGALWLRFTAPAASAGPAAPLLPRAVAVRPFLNLGPDTAGVELGPALAEDLADALGRVHGLRVADPASVSIVTYTALRPFVVRINDGGGDLSFLAPKPRRKSRRKAGSPGSSSSSSSDAAVGGGAGPQA